MPYTDARRQLADDGPFCTYQFRGFEGRTSTVEQNRLHTFRLTSNAILNRQAEPQREQLLRDAKTLAFFVKRLTGRRYLPNFIACYPVRMPPI